MESYSDGTSETRSDDELEYTQIERFVGVNGEDDDTLDTCQAGGGQCLFVGRRKWFTRGSSRPWRRL